MSHSVATGAPIRKDLGEGLVLRQAAAEDTVAAADFQARVHARADESGEPFRVWTNDLMTGALPGTQPGDFTLVEDTSTGAIVSMLNLIPQTWSYEGARVAVSRVELVSTDPDYRRRGLIRAQMEAVHEISARRGEKLQVISGIPWYYRQFGYEMAVEYGFGYRCPRSGRPAPDTAEVPAYRVRRAESGDIPFVSRLYDQGMARYIVSCVRDEPLWRYELSGRSANSYGLIETCVLESTSGAPVGVLAHARELWNGDLNAILYELEDDASWHEVTPSVVRYLQAAGEEYGTGDEPRAFRDVMLALSTEHPAYEVVEGTLPHWERPRAWYVRVPDLVDFLHHLTPVLERRLAGSDASSHTGELSIGFIDDGVRLSFENGRLARVDRSPKPAGGGSFLDRGSSDALFPGLTFLQMLFGFRSTDELEHAFPDCEIRSEPARVVLDALFPKGPSHIWAIS